MATLVSAPTTCPAIGGGPSPQTNTPSQTDAVAESWSLQVLTLNINSWTTFKERWATTTEPEELQSATVMLLQETHLATAEQCGDATEWLEKRGWRGIFVPAQHQPSGRTTGGVAICVRHRADVGVTLPNLESENPHRLLAVKLAVSGLPEMLVVCIYMEAGVGLNRLNRTLLATAASWQEEMRLPILMGGDFNVRPRTLQNTDFLARASMTLLAPSLATYRTAKSATVIDYFIASGSIAEQVATCQTLRDFPSRPHRPVQLALEVHGLSKVPILESPTRLPLQRPFGPAPEALRWEKLEALTKEAHVYIDTRLTAQQERVQLLDHVYCRLAKDLEKHLCAMTDTPRRRSSCRGKLPRIRYVTADTRAQRQFRGWYTLEKPLHWLLSWAQDAIRYINAIGEDATSAAHLAEELENCPSEFREVPQLIHLHQKARTYIQAMQQDERAGFESPLANQAALNHLQHEINERMREERESSSKHYTEAWRSWIGTAQTSHTGWAHRWTSNKEHWKPPRASESFTGKPQDELDAECTRLSNIWQCESTPHALFEPPEEAWRELTVPDAESFIKAAKSFPARTAQTWDGFHPRHFSMVTLEQAEAIIEVLRLMERIGATPSAIRAIFGRLIPKHKAEIVNKISYRSIGLLPALYRQWARLRQDEARAWESRNPSRIFAHQSGRSIMETVLVQSMRAEAAAARGEHYACFLWDMSNFYEFISAELLWERGKARRFPLSILAVSLNQYRGKRFLGLDQLAVECGHPLRGIAAGCGFATVYVQVYSIDPLEAWSGRHPALDLSVFIDDFMSDNTSATEHQVTGRLAAGAADLRHTVEHELGCHIADHKSAIIASGHRLLERCKKAFGRYAGSTSAAASNLGVDVFAGKRRTRKSSTPTLQRRRRQLLRRVRRLQTLRRGGYDMRKLYVTGVQQFAYYGAEVVGMTQTELAQARSNYLSLIGSPAKSSSASLSCAVLGDPLWRQALGPFITYTSVIWKASTSSTFQQFVNLPKMGQLAGDVIQKLPTTWGGVAGPLGAAHLSLKRVRWAFVTPLTVKTDTGEILQLTSSPPALIYYHLQLAWKRTVSRSACKALGLQPHAQVYNAEVQSLFRSRALGPHKLTLLRVFLTHAVWSQARLRSCGYDVPAECLHCGAQDTLFHRIFVCPCMRQEREATFSQDELGWLEHSPCRAVLMQGLQLLPDPVEIRPPGIGYEPLETWTLSGRPLSDDMHGLVYTDGSCMKFGAPTWNIATWSVVKISMDGVLLAWAAGVVGRELPATSPAAENTAGLAAATISSTISEARSDYAGLEGLHLRSIRSLCNRKSPYAGVHRQIRGRAPSGFQINKVAGHASLEDCRSDDDRLNAIGNDFADRTAKALARARPQPSQSEVEEWQRQQKFLKKYLEFIPSVLSRWPSNSPSQGHKSLPKRAEADEAGRMSYLADLMGPWRDKEVQQETPTASQADSLRAEPSEPPAPPPRPDPVKHTWKWQAGRWLCTSCLATSRTAIPRQIFNCPGLSPSIRDLLRRPQGHRLQVATFTSGAGLVVICSGCGRFTTSNRRGVLHTDPCPAKRSGQAAFQSEGARWAYKRVCEGKHPSYNQGNTRVLDPCMAADALTRLAEEPQHGSEDLPT